MINDKLHDLKSANFKLPGLNSRLLYDVCVLTCFIYLIKAIILIRIITIIIVIIVITSMTPYTTITKLKKNMFKPFESGPCFEYLLQIERLRKFPTSQNVLNDCY